MATAGPELALQVTSSQISGPCCLSSCQLPPFSLHIGPNPLTSLASLLPGCFIQLSESRADEQNLITTVAHEPPLQEIPTFGSTHTLVTATCFCQLPWPCTALPLGHGFCCSSS